jgi:tripartite-type tricarboxylate transporter receptor subunit TctC
VSAAERYKATPDVPTVAESGLAGFEVIGWNGIHAPRRTPLAIIARIAQEVVRVVEIAEVQERMAAGGLDPRPLGTAEFDQFVRADHRRWTAVIKQAAIRPD